MAEPVFELREVWQTYGGCGRDAAVLRGVTATVGRGEVFAVVGPSGSGKSTLLRLLNALEDPCDGEVRCFGRDVREWDPQALRRRAAMLWQMPTMFAGTVRDNLLAPLRLRDGRDARLDPDWLAALLPSVGLDEALLDRPAEQLSIGQQQRVAFMRAMMLRPDAVLLDEPTASLDPGAAMTLLRHVSGFSRDQGLTAVLVTHQLEHARAVADRVLLLIAGEVVCIQPTREFFEAPAGERAREFVFGQQEVPA